MGSVSLSYRGHRYPVEVILLTALDYGDDPQGNLALAAALRFHWCAG